MVGHPRWRGLELGSSGMDAIPWSPPCTWQTTSPRSGRDCSVSRCPLGRCRETRCARDSRCCPPNQLATPPLPHVARPLRWSFVFWATNQWDGYVFFFSFSTDFDSSISNLMVFLLQFIFQTFLFVILL